MTTTCNSCGADIIFVPSAKSGKSMILDAKPEKRVVLVHVKGLPTGTERPIARYDMLCRHELGYIGCANQVARLVDVYIDHHATCAQAKLWQGKNRKDPPNSRMKWAPQMIRCPLPACGSERRGPESLHSHITTGHEMTETEAWLTIDELLTVLDWDGDSAEHIRDPASHLGPSGLVRYVYLGDRMTADRWRGQQCDPVRRPDGKCIVRRGTALVRFLDGSVIAVNRRMLRLRHG